MSLTTYWLSRAPGQDPEGPFTLGQLQRMHAAGSVTAESQVCRQGEEEWRGLDEELAICDMDRLVAPPAPAAMPAQAGKRKRKSKAGCGPAILFVLGLLLCFGFWPLGVGLLLVAIVLDHVSYYTACSICGNEVTPKSTLCPTCRAQLQ